MRLQAAGSVETRAVEIGVGIGSHAAHAVDGLAGGIAGDGHRESVAGQQVELGFEFGGEGDKVFAAHIFLGSLFVSTNTVNYTTPQGWRKSKYEIVGKLILARLREQEA